MITIGYIGNGKSTNRYHLPYVLQRKYKFNVKTIYARNLNKNDWDKIPGINYTDNLNDLLADNDIDLIVICTNVDSHFEYAKLVLENNKHCLVEKPFMENLVQTKQIQALAKEKNLVIQAYQNRRYDSDFITTKNVIESNKLGELLELEMHFDYYRLETSESIKSYNANQSYLYNHGCHTIDQVISYFGKPDNMHMDVRQLLGQHRMNDYFDLDFYYNNFKVSIKSSFFRVKERPSFVVYGKKGCFIKQTKDRQEEFLKNFIMPSDSMFGIDEEKHYGTLYYYDENNVYKEEKIVSAVGDYGIVYDDLYNVIINKAAKVISDEQILLQMEILEKGVQHLY